MIKLKSSNFDKNMQSFPLQQESSCCNEPRISMTNDGNRKQKCLNYNWGWMADRDPVVVNEPNLYH